MNVQKAKQVAAEAVDDVLDELRKLGVNVPADGNRRAEIIRNCRAVIEVVLEQTGEVGDR